MHMNLLSKQTWMFAHKGVDGLVQSLQEFKRFNLMAMSILIWLKAPNA
jgi:hypothetical protein